MGKINGLMWFKRRMNDSEILNHIKEIVNEGFYYISPCDYINQYDDFLGEILYSVTITFINSYEELYNKNLEPHKEFINKVYSFLFNENFDFDCRSCVNSQSIKLKNYITNTLKLKI